MVRIMDMVVVDLVVMMDMVDMADMADMADMVVAAFVNYVLFPHRSNQKD